MHDTVTAASPLSLTNALVSYETTYLRARNLAPCTRAEYLTDLTDLIEFLETQKHVRTIQEVVRPQLEAYLATLDSRGMAGSTRRRKVASIRSFFFYLEDAGLRVGDPARRLIPPAREHRTPRYLTEREYKALLDAVRHEPRDAAIVELLLQTGMRLSQLARLQVTDVDLPLKISKEPGNAGSVHILGKRRKERTVTLNWKACKALKAYFAVRPDDTDDPHLFLTKFKAGIGPRSIEAVVTKYLTEAGIQGASVHTLRHTFGTHTVKRGTRLNVVKEALGHSSLKTTSIYVQLAREDMDRQLQENAL
jgi:integrase/recombinase XerC